jgi:transmembrane 9 superfamily protein 2/4
MALVFLFSMCIGMIHESVRIAWFISAWLILAGAGWFNGFVTARCMKSFGSTDWVGGVTLSAFVYPSFVMVAVVMVDVIEWIEKSSAGLPLTSVFLYGAVWMTMSISMCYHGATVGYRQSSFEFTTK